MAGDALPSRWGPGVVPATLPANFLGTVRGAFACARRTSLEAEFDPYITSAGGECETRDAVRRRTDRRERRHPPLAGARRRGMCLRDGGCGGGGGEDAAARSARLRQPAVPDPPGRELALPGQPDRAEGAGVPVRERAQARGGRLLLARDAGRAGPDRGGGRAVRRGGARLDGQRARAAAFVPDQYR